MDTPVTRTKQQIIGFYARGLLDFMELRDKQYDLFCMALTLACNEMEDRSAGAYAKLSDKWADANNEVVRLKQANAEAEEEIGRLCSELQALQVRQVATIQMNGTAPTHEPEDPPAMPQQLQPDAPAGHRRGGRKPGTNKKRGPYKKKGATADEIAQQLEGAVVQDAPAVGRIDRSLIGDDPNEVTLSGKLRREESHVTTQHGIPVRVTRQYIEIR